MAVNELWYDTLGQARRVSVERSLMGLVQDLLERGGYIWSNCSDVWRRYESQENGRGMHFGVQSRV